MPQVRYTIELKHDTLNKTWKRLSVTALTAVALEKDGDAYRDQFARERGMNQDQVAWRVIEIDSADVGNLKAPHRAIVTFKPSAASANRPS